LTAEQKIERIRTLIASVRDYASSPVLLTSENVLALCDRLLDILEDKS